MDSLLTQLGVDWKLLLAQLVNFLILLAILYKFLYKPVLKILHDREEKIEKSLKQAEEIQENLQKSQEERAQIIKEARDEAGKIISESKETAKKLKEELSNEAKVEAQNILEQGKAHLEFEREAMFKEIKGEVADMVRNATEKIIKEKMDPDKDRNLIEKSLEDLK